MAGGEEDVAADVAELQLLLQKASRSRVREILSRQIALLQSTAKDETNVSMDVGDAEEGRTEASAAASAAATVASVPAANRGAPVSAAAAVPVPVPLNVPVLLQTGKAPVSKAYSTVSSFSWDQDNEKVKIYFFLEGVPKDGVELDVRPLSVDVRMHDAGAPGKNLRFGVPRLSEAVDPAGSRVVVKPERVTVILKKKARGQWMDLSYKEDQVKPTSKLQEKKDPMAGIMDLMKNMYDDGDEDTKRSIAKAWSEAQGGGKAGDPSGLGSFGGF